MEGLALEGGRGRRRFRIDLHPADGVDDIRCLSFHVNLLSIVQTPDRRVHYSPRGNPLLASRAVANCLTPYRGTESTLVRESVMMTIGELAESAGVGVETIRFYERKELITQPKRTGSGFRRYDDETERRIRFIREAQELGFALAEIKQLLELRLDPGRSCADVKLEAENKIADIDGKMASLLGMKKALVEITRSCSGEGPTSACPILDAIQTSAARRKTTGNTDRGTGKVRKR